VDVLVCEYALFVRVEEEEEEEEGLVLETAFPAPILLGAIFPLF